MYSSSTKVEHATDITLGRIVRFKKLSKRKTKKVQKVQISCLQCDLRLLFPSNFASQCAILMENYTNGEMTDMELCYGSADGVALRAQALYREKFPARRVAHSQTFLTVVQRLRENGTFRPRSVDRGQECTPRMLDLELQILKTGRKPVHNYPTVSTPIVLSNQTISFAGKSFVSRQIRSASINLIFCE
jgi:hypothetical protein